MNVMSGHAIDIKGASTQITIVQGRVQILGLRTFGRRSVHDALQRALRQAEGCLPSGAPSTAITA